MPTIQQIIERAILRLDENNTANQNDLWTVTELIDYADEAQMEACRRADLLKEKNDPDLCHVIVQSDEPDYALHPKALRVIEAYLGPSVWGDLSWQAATRTLVDPLNGMLNAGFLAGTIVMVKGFTRAGNNGVFTIAGVTAGGLTVAETTMTDETGNLVWAKSPQKPLTKRTRNQMDYEFGIWNNLRGEPDYFITEAPGELVLAPIPKQNYAIDMIVTRLPKVSFVGLDPTRTIPEIADQYHYDLVDWICHLAYLKRDADSFNGELADHFEKSFDRKFGPRPSARAEQDRRARPRPRMPYPREFGF